MSKQSPIKKNDKDAEQEFKDFLKELVTEPIIEKQKTLFGNFKSDAQVTITETLDNGNLSASIEEVKKLTESVSDFINNSLSKDLKESNSAINEFNAQNIEFKQHLEKIESSVISRGDIESTKTEIKGFFEKYDTKLNDSNTKINTFTEAFSNDINDRLLALETESIKNRKITLYFNISIILLISIIILKLLL